MTEDSVQEDQSVSESDDGDIIVEELSPPTKVDIFNARVLLVEHFVYTIGMVVATIVSWAFLIFFTWSWFLVPAVYVAPLNFGHACGFALFFLALSKMGRSRPGWMRRPSWLECNETVRRGLIVEDIQNGVVRPLFYTALGWVVHLIFGG